MTLLSAIRRARRAVEAMAPRCWVYGEPVWVDQGQPTPPKVIARQIEESFEKGWGPPVEAHPNCACYLSGRGKRGKVSESTERVFTLGDCRRLAEALRRGDVKVRAT